MNNQDSALDAVSTVAAMARAQASQAAASALMAHGLPPPPESVLADDDIAIDMNQDIDDNINNDINIITQDHNNMNNAGASAPRPILTADESHHTDHTNHTSKTRYTHHTDNYDNNYSNHNHEREHSHSRSHHSHHSHHDHSHSREQSRSRSHSRGSSRRDSGVLGAPDIQKRLSTQLSNQKNKSALGHSPLLPMDIMNSLHLTSQPSMSFSNQANALKDHSSHRERSRDKSRDHRDSKHRDRSGSRHGKDDFRDNKDRDRDREHSRSRSTSRRDRDRTSDNDRHHDRSRSRSSRHGGHSGHDKRRSISKSHSRSSRHHERESSRHGREHSRDHRHNNNDHHNREHSRSMSRSKSRSSRSHINGLSNMNAPPMNRLHTTSYSHGGGEHSMGGIKNFEPNRIGSNNNHQYSQSYSGSHRLSRSQSNNNVGAGLGLGRKQSNGNVFGNNNTIKPGDTRSVVGDPGTNPNGNGVKGKGSGKWFAWGGICLVICIICFVNLGEVGQSDESRQDGGMMIMGALLSLLCMVVGFVQGCSAMKSGDGSQPA